MVIEEAIDDIRLKLELKVLQFWHFEAIII